MRRKGFTLVELLVVIAIIALLMGILMPALARVRQIAYRLYCGTNLSGIGKAMLIYSNDYDDEMPRAGLKDSTWMATIPNWRNVTRTAAFTSSRSSVGSITSNFYLLVKYAEVTPKSFLCKGDSGVTEFRLSETDLKSSGAELIDCWDFGPTPQRHCSYSYHIPYGVYALTALSEPGMAVAADANPWLNSPGSDARPADQWTKFTPTGDREVIKFGNAQVHQDDGQNVLYMDGHTSFEKNSACGVDDDNIYTQANLPSDKKKGTRATAGMQPVSRTDSLLLTDGTK